MKIYVSKQPISDQIYTRAYRLPLNIRVEPTYWLKMNKKNAFIPLMYNVQIENISLIKYLYLIWKSRRV